MTIGAKNSTLSCLPSSLSRITRSNNRSARSPGDIAEMSGARTTSAPDPAPFANGASPVTGWSAALGSVCATGPDRPSPMPKLRPATTAIIAMSAIAVTAHGSKVALRPSMGDAAPTAVPHRWQNLAPAVSDERHAAQSAPSNGAPQSAQNRPPVDAAPQFPHRRPAAGPPSEATAGVVLAWPLGVDADGRSDEGAVMRVS